MALLPLPVSCGFPAYYCSSTRRCWPVRSEQIQPEHGDSANMPQGGPAAQRKNLSVADMKAALGMADERKAGSRPDMEKKNPILSRLEDAGQYLEDYTDSQSGPIGGGVFVLTLLLFPVWLVYLLTAADMIHPPFPLPFLTN